MITYRCLHSRAFNVCLINCRLDQVPLYDDPQNDIERQATNTLIKCGIAIFSARLTAPMGLYDLDTEQYVGRVEIPDEALDSIVPQSFCDPDDDLPLSLLIE